jgi:hypothetical protein
LGIPLQLPARDSSVRMGILHAEATHRQAFGCPKQDPRSDLNCKSYNPDCQLVLMNHQGLIIKGSKGPAPEGHSVPILEVTQRYNRNAERKGRPLQELWPLSPLRYHGLVLGARNTAKLGCISKHSIVAMN